MSYIGSSLQRRENAPGYYCRITILNSFFVPRQKKVNPLVPCPINPLTPVSDQNRISPYNINT